MKGRESELEQRQRLSALHNQKIGQYEAKVLGEATNTWLNNSTVAVDES